MDISKFNSNYQYNSKYNMHKILKIVNELKKEDINNQLFDFLFRFNARNYPKTVHELLELPGIFKKIEDTAVIVVDDGILQMDHTESVAPDGDLVQRNSIVDVEHQSNKLDFDKVKKIFDYCLNTTILHKKLCYPIVVTNYDYGKEFEDYDIEGFSFRIYFRIFNMQKVYEILNKIKQKDYTKEELSNADYINLIFCIIFAKKPYAQDVISKIAHLFATIEKIRFNHQMDLHLALKLAIKYHFRGNDEKIEEFLIMITMAIHESRVDHVTGYEVEQFSIDELKTKNSILKAEYERQRRVLEAENERQRRVLEAENEKQRKVFEAKIDEKSKQIEELEKKIKMLTKEE